MKRVILLAAALVVMPAVFAQSGGMKGMDTKMEKKDAKASVHSATGVVTKLGEGKVTIKHGPVRSMNWPTMTMSFKVKDKAIMEKMKKDRKVDFDFVQEGRDYVVTGVK